MREKSATSSPASGPVGLGAGEEPGVIVARLSSVRRTAVRCERCRSLTTAARQLSTAAAPLDTWWRSRPLWRRPLGGQVSAMHPEETTMSVPGPTSTAGPVVLRGGTVLTMDDAHTVLPRGDVLVVDGQVAAVGTQLDVPEGTQEIDATGGVVMPGMIDTHRHMWQTAMRGYGADWTLTQYFVWYYLEHGRTFRPEDVHAGNLLSALGGPGGRGHHHGRLEPRAAERGPRRGRRRRAARRPRPVRAGLRQHPGRSVGVDRRPGRAGLPHPPARRGAARAAAGLRRHR